MCLAQGPHCSDAVKSPCLIECSVRMIMFSVHAHVARHAKVSFNNNVRSGLNIRKTIKEKQPCYWFA